MDQLQKRHGAHHHDNVKYGYVIFCVSVLYALIIAFSNFMFMKRWNKRDSPPHSSIWGRLRSVERWWIHIVLWVAIIVGLTFFNIKEPIEQSLTIIKRLGRLAFCIVPLDVLLVIRPSLLTNSYLELITLHKWFSRVIIATSFAHGLGFCVKWILQGVFWSKVLAVKNFLGVLTIVPALALLVISARPVRERMYRLFYVWHNVVVVLFLVPMFWHARPGVSDFILLLVVMLAFQLYQKLSSVHAVGSIQIVDHGSSSLQMLRIQKPTYFPSTWLAGSHVRLSYPMSDVKYWLFSSHPYTIASIPEDRTIDLVVRKGLQFQVFSSLSYSLSNPHVSLPSLFFETAQNVVILCGGSGISLGAPLLRELQTRSNRSAKLVWCISNKNDLFVLNELNITLSVEVYVTREVDRNELGKHFDEQADSLLTNDEAFEMRTLDQDLINSSADQADKLASSKEKIDLRFGRPDLNSIFTNLVSTESSGNHWVIACGPQAMIDEASQWSRSQGVLFFSEHYGF